MNSKQLYYKLLSEKLIEEFAKRNIEGEYFESKEDALKKIIETTPSNATISCGGSETLHEIGLIEQLRKGPYSFLDPLAGEAGAEKEKVAYQALTADYFFMGCNAITETGELVNIDGIGNRVAALCFGPKHVIIVAGMNKVMPDLESAINRAEVQASKMIVLKFSNQLSSFDELHNAALSAGSQLVITRRSIYKNRIKVILVGESLGY